MKYETEASINKLLAQMQLAGAAIEQDNKDDEDSFEVLLREALKSENEAIEIYIKLKEKSDAIGSAVLVKAFEAIQKDEQTHIGNLQYLMKLLCENAVDVEKEGEAEEAELQASTKE